MDWVISINTSLREVWFTDIFAFQSDYRVIQHVLIIKVQNHMAQVVPIKLRFFMEYKSLRSDVHIHIGLHLCNFVD